MSKWDSDLDHYYHLNPSDEFACDWCEALPGEPCIGPECPNWDGEMDVDGEAWRGTERAEYERGEMDRIQRDLK